MQCAVYCGGECQREHWQNEHKQWHKELAIKADYAQQSEYVRGNRPGPTSQSLVDISDATDAYALYLGKGQQLCDVEHNYKQAAKYFRKAVEADPDQPMGYYNLGNALQRSNDPANACEQFLISAGKAQAFDDNRFWARGTAMAFQNWAQVRAEGGTSDAAEFRTDDQLLATSAVVYGADDHPSVMTMRGRVLRGIHLAWMPGKERTPEDFREAARCFFRAAQQEPCHADSSKEAAMECLAKAKLVATRSEMSQFARSNPESTVAKALKKLQLARETPAPTYGRFCLEIGPGKCSDAVASRDEKSDYWAIEGLEDGHPAPTLEKRLWGGWLELGTVSPDLECEHDNDGSLLVNGVKDELTGRLWHMHVTAEARTGKFSVDIPKSTRPDGIKDVEGSLSLSASGFKDSAGHPIYVGKFELRVKSNSARVNRGCGKWETSAMHFRAFHAPGGTMAHRVKIPSQAGATPDQETFLVVSLPAKMAYCSRGDKGESRGGGRSGRALGGTR